MILKLDKRNKINAKSNPFKYDTKRLNHCMLASKTHGHSSLRLPIVRLLINFFLVFVNTCTYLFSIH